MVSALSLNYMLVGSLVHVDMLCSFTNHSRTSWPLSVLDKVPLNASPEVQGPPSPPGALVTRTAVRCAKLDSNPSLSQPYLHLNGNSQGRGWKEGGTGEGEILSKASFCAFLN